MNQIFPANLPAATQFYVALYIFTFAIHQFFMHYVLAGSLYLVVDSWIRRSQAEDNPRDINNILRDWLPFQLSATITAGVAPLLFVQILYPQHFYTANLLLAWRWMIVVPILIVAFYALYLIKAPLVFRRSRTLRVLLSGFAATCFLFVGFSWTANYLVETSPSEWPQIYETQHFALNWLSVGSRMLVWMGGSFCTLSCVLAWQNRVDPDEVKLDGGPHTLGIMAITGLSLSLLGALVHLVCADSVARDAILSWRGGCYVATTLIGAALQVAGWSSAIRKPRLTSLARLLFTSGLVVWLLSVSTLREIMRMAVLSGPELFKSHAEAAEMGGFFVFLGLALLNGLLITLCIFICRKGMSRE